MIKRKVNLKVILLITLMLLGTTAFQFSELFNAQWVSEDGVTYEYRVQICASWQKQVPVPFLRTQFNISDTIREDFHQGWYKYSIGSFPTLSDARIYRDKLRNEHKAFGAFVVLIANDKRSDIILDYKPVDEILAIQSTSNDTTKLPDSIPEKGNSSWRVQLQTSIGSKLSADGIRLFYSIQDSIYEEIANGNEYFYTVGNFTTYDSAATYCDYLRTAKNIRDAIVISYFNNQRISTVKRNERVVSVKKNSKKVRSVLVTPRKKAQKINFTSSEPVSKPVITKKQTKSVTLSKSQRVSVNSDSEQNQKQKNRAQSKPVRVQKTVVEKNTTTAQIKEKLVRDSQIYYNENDTFVSSKPVYTARQLPQKHKLTAEEKTERQANDSINKNEKLSNLAVRLIMFGQKYFSRPNSKIFTRFVDKVYRDLLVFVIIIIVIYFSINLVIITFLVIASRLVKDFRSSRRAKYQMLYNEIIANFLFDDSDTTEVPAGLGAFHSKFQRNIFIDELMKLSTDLAGEALDRLKQLYYNLGLDEDTMKKIESWRWHIRAKGYKEATRMEVYRAASKIEKYLNSKNEIIRSEAGLALIQLNKQYPFEFLEKIQRPLTLWDQINIHTLINKNKIEIPDFGRWLQMNNLSVVLFAIRMIRVFEQTHNAPYILDLLDSKNCSIRKEAIRAIAQFGYIDAIYKLIEIYPFEKEENQLIILEAFRSIPDESTYELLIPILEGNSEHQFKMVAARALLASGAKGRAILQGLLAQADPHTQKVIHHVFDTRI
jgi:hypothetical protein